MPPSSPVTLSATIISCASILLSPSANILPRTFVLPSPSTGILPCASILHGISVLIDASVVQVCSASRDLCRHPPPLVNPIGTPNIKFFPYPFDADAIWPHAYFRQLAETHSNCNANSYNMRPTWIEPTAEGHGAIALTDTSPILDSMESGRRW